VEGDEDAGQEGFVLLLQGESKTVDDGAQNFKEFCDAIMAFCLVNELEENVIDGSANEGTKVEKFAVDTMEGSFEKVAFSRILRVEELEEIKDEGLIDVTLCHVSVEIGAFDESEEEFIDNL